MEMADQGDKSFVAVDGELPLHSNAVDDMANQNKPESTESSVKKSKLDGALMRYSVFMVKYPYFNLIIVLVLFIWAGVIGFVKELGAQPLPNFAKPTKGFKPRDTDLSNSRQAVDNLEKFFRSGGLSYKPFPYTGVSTRKKRSISPQLEDECSPSFIKWDVETNKVIYAGTSGENLLNAARLREICILQADTMTSNFGAYVKRNYRQVACPSHSIPNYVVLAAGKPACVNITDADVEIFKTLIKVAAPLYSNGRLKVCLDNSTTCANLPDSVNTTFKARLAHSTFLYLADKGLLENPGTLRQTLVSERFSAPYDLGSTFYKHVYQTKLKSLKSRVKGNVKIVAFDFWDFKFKIFEEMLFTEGALLSVAVLLVFILIMVYSGSIFIGIMTFVCVIVAAVLAYFFYGIIFRLSFFPFLNVLTLIFLVGIGADDAFVYMGAWKEAKKMFPCKQGVPFDVSLAEWTAYTLKHAIIAMFVTSFTTASAFYASASSKIIAIRCFGVYAGTSIIMNYFLMVVWFPAIVIISEKYFGRCMSKISPKCYADPTEPPTTAQPDVVPRGCFDKLKLEFTHITTRVFSEILPMIVINFKYMWILLFTALGIGGMIVLFVEPKLRLPIASDFQMFSDSDSLEQYPLHYKNKFIFSTSGSGYTLNAYMVFGVKNENTASMMKPDDKGKLQLENTFSISSPAEQIWLKRFCENLQNASFSSKQYWQRSTCKSVLTFWNYLTTNCSLSHPLGLPCCSRKIPMNQNDFDNCLKGFTVYLPNTVNSILYDKRNQTRALKIYVATNFKYTETYSEANKIYTQINAWFNAQKKNAPSSFKKGFWHTYLQFFDLQRSLASGTPVSLGISVAIAFAVVLLTTWNVLISLYTVISIAFVISVTVGTLVLAGWRLNIMESIIFSVAAGLAVDFTLHYGVAYRTATDKSSRENRVRYSFIHLGSAVTMGAVTTFISGMVMAPASVLVYIQLSHFLMVLMLFSWLYATFFFMPLCSALGPTNNFCQLSWKRVFPGGKEKRTATLNNENIAFEGHEMQSAGTKN